MKASEDIDFVDTTYGLNRARAKAAGFVIGAYHFAQPDPAPGDAIAEADHFLDTAGIADGDLPPVLDLERTGGLTAGALRNWVTAYLERIPRADRRPRGHLHVAELLGQQHGQHRLVRHERLSRGLGRALDDRPGSDGPGVRLGRLRLDVLAVHLERDRRGITGSRRPRPVRWRRLLVGPDRPRDRGRDSAPPKPPFTDIKKSKFAKDIAWLFAIGHHGGCSKTKFCPNDTVTRGQMASFLARALNLPKSKKDYFRDDNGLQARGEHQPARQGRADDGLRDEAVLPEPGR